MYVFGMCIYIELEVTFGKKYAGLLYHFALVDSGDKVKVLKICSWIVCF